ncbi:MAG: hypothetical protein Ta2G_06110 [Termitinemataceae bacterium]|nr:MAG: hypothetical protein Ta2G_06110 [Termitinemataceae bacterium]
MKKCFMVIMILLVAPLCFAQKNANVEVYGGAALFDETGGMNGPKTVYKSTSISAGISGGFYFNETIGLKAYLDFLIPLLYTAVPEGGTTATRGDYDFLLGMDKFFGVVFNVIKTERFKLPIMAGFHGKIFFSTMADYFTTSINSGIGLGIGVEYAFSNNCYILARVNGSFDFLGFSILTPPEGGPKFDLALIRTWGFAPHLGIGFRF